MKKTSYLLTSPVPTQRVSFTACIKNHAQRLADTLTEWISAYTGDELSKEEIKPPQTPKNRTPAAGLETSTAGV